MRKINKILLLLVGILTLNTTTVLADVQTKYKADRNNYYTTTEGIDIEYDKENNKITYILTEKFNSQKAYFNLTQDLKNILEKIYMPGSSAEFQIQIINESKYDYHYVTKSLTVDSLDLDSNFDTDYSNLGENVWYNYTMNGTTGKYIKGAKGFDGSRLLADYTTNRTANIAIRELFKSSSKTENGYYEGCNVSVINNDSTACKNIMTDEVIGAELIAKNYENGIEDLNKYYLDYYNKKYNTNAEKLEDLPEKAIFSILGGNRQFNKETNPEVSELGYNWFYNECLYLGPSNTLEGDHINLDRTYSIGAYMRGENNLLEEMLSNDFTNISSGSEVSSSNMKMQLSGRNTINVFMDMNFGFMISFSLEREEVGTVITNYVDSDGNKLTEEIITEGKVGNEYTTEKKDFTGYTYITVVGEPTGTYINDIIYVTYYYDKNTGTGDIEELPPKTGFTGGNINTINPETITLYKKED